MVPFRFSDGFASFKIPLKNAKQCCPVSIFIFSFIVVCNVIFLNHYRGTSPPPSMSGNQKLYMNRLEKKSFSPILG